MKMKNGEEYLSSKDACAISGFSEDELRSLCLEGKVKSRWIGGGYFVERKSLLSLLKKKTFLPYSDIDLQHSFDIWHSRVFKKFGIFTMVIIVFLVIFVLPLFFFENIGISSYDVAKVPAPFNSVIQVSNTQGTMATVGYLNETIATAIEKSIIGTYNLIFSWF